jgi:hypothetical protein
VDCSPPAKCGDKYCGPGESPANCPTDCINGRYCGDGLCTQADGENSSNCPGDCNRSAVCGNGVCEGPAEQFGCPQDCGPLPPVPTPAPTVPPSTASRG